MAGPSIVVRVLGDVKGFGASMAATSKQAEGASSRIRGAFSSALGTLNRTGVLGPFGESIAQVNDSLDAMAGKGKTAGKVMLGLGGTLVGVGVGLSALGSADQAARQQLQAAVEAAGASWDDYDKQIEAAIKHQEKFGDTANQTQDALRVLTTATNSPTKALQLLTVTTDLAAAKHESLSEAATQVGKVYNGNTKLLKQFGITVTNTAGATKAAATATKQAQTADKQLAAAKQRLADVEAIDAGKKHLTVAEAIRLRDAEQKVKDATAASVAAHQNLTNAQTAAAAATKGHGTAVDQLSQKLSGQGAAAADTYTGKLHAIIAAVEDLAAKFGQKYGPAITAGAVAVTALGTVTEGVGAILKKFTAASEAATVATEAQTVALEGEAAAAETADVASLPLIATFGLIVAAIAALGVAAYEIYTHWSQIWPRIQQIAGNVADYITNSWNNLIADLQAIPGQIANIASHMWDSVYTNFRNTMQQIADYHVQLPAGLGSLDIGSIVKGPFWDLIHGKIPFMAQGGMITSDGLIYAHAGETVIPAGRTVPAVQIDGGITLNNGVDVELFARKLAWAVQTQGV